METFLLTGGGGFIGSHAAVSLLSSGYKVIVLDNFSNSLHSAMEGVARVAENPPVVIKGDVRDASVLDEIFQSQKIDAVLHFAGLKSVYDSFVVPEEYYHCNVCGTLSLLQKMEEYEVRKLIFSSSATVYGADAAVPFIESAVIGNPTNPYGASKAMVERILSDYCSSNSSWSVVALRYFNPIGAHESGLIGEVSQDLPPNLLPYLNKVAAGVLDKLMIFGCDYGTPDGTCLRDYIHVMDLAEGHVAALQILDLNGYHVFNLGTGRPFSVLEVVKTFEDVTGIEIPYSFVARRAGDLEVAYADISKASKVLGWSPKRTLRDMISDGWRWQRNLVSGLPSVRA